MRGSAVYQILQIWKLSGIDQIGTSRHEAKDAARTALSDKHLNATPHRIALNTGIHSYGTADAYRDVWISILRHSKEFDGTKDIERLTGEQVASFLRSKIESGVAYATYQQYAAASQKLGVALQRYSAITGTGRTYDFASAIKDASAGRESLKKFSGTRAYNNPQSVIAAITNPDHRLAATLQYSCAARVSDIALIKHNQLLGISKDLVTGEDKGTISAQSKGGRVANYLTDIPTYRHLEKIIEERGEFRINADDYRHSIRDAAHAVGETYMGKGSHGLRWNRASEKCEEGIRHGMHYSQALASTALALNHSRTSITEHYRGK
jgi:hypothetical protein